MLCAQLMIVLDMTVVNIALPSIAHGLHFTASSLSWVLNAYALTFGGLLLLGGRAGDILGRRRVFLAGLALFTVASLAGGLATSAPWLLAARAAQGVGGADRHARGTGHHRVGLSRRPGAHPRPEPVHRRDDGRRLAGPGARRGHHRVGSWRWVLFINVPIGLAVLLIGPRFIAESTRQPGRLDLAGALTSTLGMSALVYGFIKASSSGWSDRLTLAAFAAAVVLLASFITIETRSPQPITPLRLFTDRSRSASFVVRLLLVAGMFGMFFFLTQFVQEVLGLTPLQAGLSFLPMTGALFAVSRLAPVLIPRFGAKPLMVAGLIPAVAGMAWLGQLSPTSTYLSGVLGPMLLLGVGMGMAFVPLTMTSLAGVAPEDSGAAASMVNVTQQVGGALGPGHPGHRVRHGQQGRGAAPAGPRRGGRPGAPRPDPRHGGGLHRGGRFRPDRAAGRAAGHQDGAAGAALGGRLRGRSRAAAGGRAGDRARPGRGPGLTVQPSARPGPAPPCDRRGRARLR